MEKALYKLHPSQNQVILWGHWDLVSPAQDSPCAGSCPWASSPFIPWASFFPVHGYTQLWHGALTDVTGENWLGHVYWEAYVRFGVRKPQLCDESFYQCSAFVPGVIAIGLCQLGSLSLMFSPCFLGLSEAPNCTSLRIKRTTTLSHSCRTRSSCPLWTPGNKCKGLSIGKAGVEPFVQKWP